MQSLNNDSIQIDPNWYKKEKKKNLYLALSILLACWGIAFFLYFYLNYSVVGFILLVFCWLLSFLFFKKMPSSYDKVKPEALKIVDIESLKNSYEMDKKRYQKSKKISTGILILFDLIFPLVAFVFYSVQENIKILDLILGTSMLITGVVLYLWIRRYGSVEIIRKILIS